jgi:PAS domain S-box-containing protein
MRRRSQDYLVSLAAVGAALALRWLLDPLLAGTLPFVTLFGAVAAAVWVGGRGPAILAAVLALAGSEYLFPSPVGVPARVTGALAYLLTCGLIIGIGEAARRAQRRASRDREVMEITLRSIGDAVITTDLDGRITSLNDVAELLTGWSRADALGQPLDAVFRIVNEDTRDPVESPAVRVLREGVAVGLANHTLLIARDGRELAIDDSAAPIRDHAGTVSGCVLIFRDFSAQRAVERERASQLLTARLLASIVESSDDAILSKSLDGIIQSWNEGAERLFGHSAAQALGRHISLIIPAERLEEEDRIIASLKAGERVDHFETERLRADGQRVLVSLTISPLKDEAGRVIGASKIVRDVTERRRLEDDLRRLADDLSDADRRKDEFLATLAHELRNPLATISNTVQLMRRREIASQGVDPTSEMLERQIRQMGRLVDDLLDVSRITRGKIELRKEPLELAPLVEQVAEAARALHPDSQRKLVVSLPPRPIPLNGDPTRLAQVIGNLLSNAYKFTDPGGWIVLTVESDADCAIIRVQDDGIGISPEQISQLFGLFTQLDSSLERTRNGLGIGLALARSLVQMHGGSLEARSEGIGRGSEFVVRLPLAPEPAAAAPTAATSSEPARPRRRILVVDDNQDSGESLALLLELDGYETHTARDGLEALAVAERVRPDTVLLDIGLPKLNGYEVARRLRALPWAKHVLLVAMTGWGQDEDRQRSREAGFDAHVVKPVTHELLTRTLSRDQKS